ncbi:MAG: hypothetical protein KKB51_19450 [Candidatus Riflebacteria bacterium]|nr:hypothetical protein [Candidatus Riflebacteria bacterium]
MKVKLRHRWFIVLFCLWLAFEPLALAVLHANDDVPKPILNTEGIEGIVDVNEIEAPADYLEYVLALRGRNKEEAEAKAWGDWMMTLSGAYMMMDDGCSDVFSFYSTLSDMSPHFTNTPYYFKAVAMASSKAALAFTFVANAGPIVATVKLAGDTAQRTGLTRGAAWAATKVSTIAKWTGSQVANSRLYQKGVGFIQRKANLMNGFQRMGNMASSVQKTFSANNVSTFLSHMAPPCGYKAGPGEGFYSYWRWVARKTGLENQETYRAVAKKAGINTNRGAAVINDAKGVGHTVGIGLCVLGIAIDTYGIITSEDRQGGRYGSYPLVKNYVGLALGSAALIAMFCIPVVGQVIGALALIWTALTTIGNILGDYNKRWKSAYKGSYWYLYENDPEFKSFYDNRGQLDPNEKAVALLVTESNYGDFIKNATAETEEEQAIQEKNLRVYKELEKQGVLVSYYSQKGFSLPDFGMERLQELWQMKADYMSWKPTEAETDKAAKRGFWGKVGHAINPMTYVSWAGDKIQSRDYKKTIEDYNILKVFFNPDYVLIKKYQNWITANNFRGGIFDVVGLRMEQSPFNYIPLVGIDSGTWNEDLLIQAFNADAFQVGIKELMYFKEQIKAAREQVKDSIKDNDKMVDFIRKEHLKYYKNTREALEKLVRCYDIDPNAKLSKKDWKVLNKGFGWKWNSKLNDNPKNIIRIYQGDIEQALLYDPLSIAQKAADTVMMVATVKKNLDLAVMMTELGEEKRQVLKDFKTDFTNYDIAKFLKEGTFLDVKGKTFWDWLADIYPAYEEMEKHTKLYMNEVEDFTEIADASNSDSRSAWVIFSKDGYHPKNLLKDLNAELDAYKKIVDDFEKIKSETGLYMALSDSDLYKGVFSDKFVADDPEALDLDFAVSSVVPSGD